MRLLKCDNGHVYDADKLKNCPHCQGIVKILMVMRIHMEMDKQMFQQRCLQNVVI